jgi:Domain of unknown function DUF11
MFIQNIKSSFRSRARMAKRLWLVRETQCATRNASVRRLLFTSRRQLARLSLMAAISAFVLGPGLVRQPARAAAGGAVLQGDGLTAEGVVLDFDTGSHKKGDVISLARIFRDQSATIPATASDADKCPSRHLHGVIWICNAKAHSIEGPFADPFNPSDPNPHECGHGMVIPYRADVSVSVTGRTTAAVGDSVTYTVTLTNNGPHTADVVFSVFPTVAFNNEELSFPASFRINTPEGCDSELGLACGTGGLPAKGQKTLVYTLNITDSKFIKEGTLTVTFTADTFAGSISGCSTLGGKIDPVLTNNAARATTQFIHIDPGTASDRFGSALYLNVLHRPVDPAALLIVENSLTSGHTHQEVALGVLSSAEYRQDLVQSDFREFLHRDAKSSELANLVNFLINGGTDEQIMAQIFGTTEYFNLSGGNNDNFLTQLFIDLFGRTPSSSERTAETNQLSSGQTAQQVAQGLLNTQEYRQNLVQADFLKFLLRAPTSVELDNFTIVLSTGGTEEQAAAQIIGSDMFDILYPAFPVYEGSADPVIIGTFTSPNTGAQASDFTATINWGDGSTSSGTLTAKSPGSGTVFVSGSHAYVAPFTFTASIQAIDKGGNTTTFANPLMVVDAPLIAVGTRTSASPSVMSSGVVATFTDPNPGAQATEFTTTIDWGDGTTSTGTVTITNSPSGLAPQAASAAFKVSGSHAFATAGEFAVNATITDKNGSTATAHSRATVGPDFSISFDSPTVTAQAGTKARVTVNINRTGGFTGSVTVTPPPAANGIKAKPADPITTTDSTATFKMKIGGGVSPGQYPLTFTAQDATGKTRTGTVTLVVQ